MTHAKRLVIFFGSFAALMLFLIMLNIGQWEREALDATWNKLKPNDSVYARAAYLTDTGFVAMITYRLIRPFTKEDIDTMDIPNSEKLRLIAQIDTSAEHNRPVAIQSKLSFMQDSMYKYRTAAIGTYVKSDSLAAKFIEKVYFPEKWQVIIPNPHLIDTNFSFKMPRNYKFVDDYCYMDAMELSREQFEVFKQKKQ